MRRKMVPPPVARQPRSTAPLLSVRNLVKVFADQSSGFLKPKSPPVQAVSDVSFDLFAGEVLSLVGESGCGKSTTGRCLLRLIEPTSGSVTYNGEEILTKSARAMRALRQDLQMVFQDPFSSLHPKRRIRDIVAEPLIIHGMARGEAHALVPALLDMVSLPAEHANKYPHEFSGGQLQRIGIARALSVDPKVLVLDEPVSALDVSIQAGVLRLLEQLRDQLDLTYLFIAHDLSVVRHISNRTAVMYLGKIVEIGNVQDIFERPTHPYTKALLSAAPIPDPRAEARRERIVLTGDVPSATNPPSGCRFRTRCWRAEELCANEEPSLVDRGSGHPVACHFPLDVTPPTAHRADASPIVGGTGADRTFQGGTHMNGTSERLQVLVVTGGHPFEEAPFLSVFASDKGIDWTHSQPPEVREWFRPEHAGRWDAIVCYDMQGLEFRKPELPKLLEPPADYAQGFKDLLEAGQGMVFLHHAMSAWPTWALWAEVVGGRWNYVPGELEGREWPASGYTREISHRISCLDPSHPICAGLEDGFEITDELYLNPVLEDTVTPLLRTDYEMIPENFFSGELAMRGRLYENEGWTHPKGSGLIGWVKTAGKSPIVYLQCGHGPAAYANAGFRKLVANAIRWVASDDAKAWAHEHETTLVH